MRLAILMPAQNEAASLAETVERVMEWSRRTYGPEASVLVSENASTDGTDALLKLLVRLHPELRVIGSERPGKGGAIKRAADAVEADVYVFMDADLATDLESAEKVVAAVRGGADMAFGSRRCPDSRVRRSIARRIVTAAYAFCAQAMLGLPVRDAQCGCKAFSRRLRDEVLPRVKDDGWFFDTELLAKARLAGMTLAEIGVRWSDATVPKRRSGVRILPTGLSFLRKLSALRKELGRKS